MKETLKIGDRVVVAGHHKNFRPVVVSFATDQVLVKILGTGGRYWFPEKDVRLAPPSKKRKK